MYPYVWRNLRRRFPAYAGWEIRIEDAWSGGRWADYRMDVIAERFVRSHWEKVIAEVKVTSRVTEANIRQLNGYAKKQAGARAKIVAKIIVVPAGADISELPADIEVMFLRAFVCNRTGFSWRQ
jgi:hypothetical protein